MQRIQNAWRYLWTSLWFLPALLVLAAVLLAVILIDIDTRLDAEIWAAWPMLFGAGAAGSRGMLQVIATSMITVAGVVFSITIAALVQASNQYSPRLLRNFMGDHTNQTVLGVFVGIFIYCLVVLRTIRGGDEGAFVPSLAVLAAVVLAFVGIGFLIYFIHHIASSVQASQIIANVAEETIAAIDRLFPEPLGHEEPPAAEAEALAAIAGALARRVPARHSGYMQSLDLDALLKFASTHAVVVRMEYEIGDFVVAGTPLATLFPTAGGNAVVDDAATAELNRTCTVGRQRTIDQDAAFGVRQIVDVANKALSPGINDTTTAVLCVEHLTAILIHLAPRRIENPFYFAGGELRVIARGPSFASLLAAAYDEIRRNAAGNVTVLTRLAAALALLAGATPHGARQAAIRRQVEALHEVVGRTVRAPQERSDLARQCRELLPTLSRSSAAHLQGLERTVGPES